MNYEEMSIEELEARERDLKAEYYDIDERKNEIKEEINIIKNVKKEKTSQIETTAEESKEEVVETPVEEVTNEEVNEESQEVVSDNVEQSQTEATPLIPVVENNEANTEPVQEVVTENAIEAPIETTPLIPVVETPTAEVHEDVVNPQTLEQTPLVPAGIEIPSVETNVEVKEEAKEVYSKVDSNVARAILINKSQSDKLKKSKELNKNLVLGDETEVKEETQVELPKVEEVAAAPVIPVQPENVSVDDKQKQLEAMVEQLGNAKTEEEANRINEEIAVLKKSLPAA